MRLISFTQDGFKEFLEWYEGDKAISEKLKQLIKEISKEKENLNHLNDYIKGVGPEELTKNIALYMKLPILIF